MACVMERRYFAGLFGNHAGMVVPTKTRGGSALGPVSFALAIAGVIATLVAFAIPIPAPGPQEHYWTIWRHGASEDIIADSALPRALLLIGGWVTSLLAVSLGIADLFLKSKRKSATFWGLAISATAIGVQLVLFLYLLVAFRDFFAVLTA